MTIAYLDPGSGSLIASALVGGVAAAGVAAKQARARLSLGRKRKQQSDVSEDSTADETVDAADGTAVEAADDAAPVHTES